MINSMQILDLPSFEGRLVTEEDRSIVSEMIGDDPVFPSLDSMLDYNTDFTALTYNTSRVFRRKEDGIDVAWALSHRVDNVMLLARVVVHPNYRRQGVLTTLRREYEQFIKLNFQTEIDTLSVHYLPERVKSGNAFDITNAHRLIKKPYKEQLRNTEEGYESVMETIPLKDL